MIEDLMPAINNCYSVQVDEKIVLSTMTTHKAAYLQTDTTCPQGGKTALETVKISKLEGTL